MPGNVLFKEDFFQRVVDVNWESEPKVYWMAGCGFPLIVNMAIFFQFNLWTFVSDDGMHWKKGQKVGLPQGTFGRWGLGVVFTGGWMRAGLKEGGMPVWYMGGGNAKFQPDGSSAASTDGLSLTVRQEMDAKHVFDSTSFPGGDVVHMLQMPTYFSFHQDDFTSSNGMQWSPAKYHGGEDSLMAAAPQAFAAQAASPIEFPTRAIIVNDPSVESMSTELMHKMMVPSKRTLLTPTPFAEGSGGQVAADKVVFNGNRVSAAGKVRKGPYSGKVISCAIANPMGNDGFHGDSKIRVTDPKGKTHTTDCGIARTECVNYGHYVFCVGGATKPAEMDQGKNQISAISYSEDGVQWKMQELGPYGQVNVLCVGPRK